MWEDIDQYNAMERVLQQIHRKFVAIPGHERKRNNIILHDIVDLIIDNMREDMLFGEIFQRLFYGGSYFEGLRVCHADEYDIHMLLELPPRVNARIQVSNVHGSVHVKFERNYSNVLRRKYNRRQHLQTSFRRWNGFRPYHLRRLNRPNELRLQRGSNFGWGFRNFIDSNNFMNATNVRDWVGRVLHTALNSFPQTRSGKFILPTQKGDFFVSTKSSGPAFTLHIERGKIHIDVDLVPCFIFDNNNWPDHPFIKNPFPHKKPRFYVVSKKPKEVQGKVTHYWVLNFQEQERELIKRRYWFKPAIKLIKKMRDLLGHDVMVSYFIKNVALWALKDVAKLPFSSYSLSFMFMTILKKYRDFLENEEIPYYWNQYFNLVKHVDSSTINSIYKKLNSIINDIERNVNNNPMVVAKYLITRREVNHLRNNYNF